MLNMVCKNYREAGNLTLEKHGNVKCVGTLS